MPLIIDDGSHAANIPEMQFFISTSNLTDDAAAIPDAKDTVDAALSHLAIDMSWTVGVKRFFYVPPKEAQKHIADLRDTIYTILTRYGDVSIVNHMPRREMYLYYTASKIHDLDYADAEYMCFEVPVAAAGDVSLLINAALLMSRNRKDTSPSLSIATAAEAGISRGRGIIKVKLMPRRVVEESWDMITDIIGEGLAGYFIDHQK